jgi:cell division GTPase FtsZ
MGTNNKKQNIETEDLQDNVTQEDDKLAALKAKLAKKEESVPPIIVEKKRRSVHMGVVGTGQCGSRIAESFYKLGYESVVINTALQDLEHIEIPNSNKLHLDFGLGGAGRELEIGHSAAESHADEIRELISKKLSESQLLLLTTSLGGGSGAGSIEVVLNIAAEFEKPIAVIAALPQSSDDAQVKNNALITLS